MRVVATLTFSIGFFLLFVFIELKLAIEPVLVPSLLKQKVPLLLGITNLLVAICNFSVMYFFPMWFQTVMLSSTAIAGKSHDIVISPTLHHRIISLGLHLLPDSVSVSLASILAG